MHNATLRTRLDPVAAAEGCVVQVGDDPLYLEVRYVGLPVPSVQPLLPPERVYVHGGQVMCGVSIEQGEISTAVSWDGIGDTLSSALKALRGRVSSKIFSVCGYMYRWAVSALTKVGRVFFYCNKDRRKGRGGLLSSPLQSTPSRQMCLFCYVLLPTVGRGVCPVPESSAACRLHFRWRKEVDMLHVVSTPLAVLSHIISRSCFFSMCTQSVHRQFTGQPTYECDAPHQRQYTHAAHLGDPGSYFCPLSNSVHGPAA